MSAAHCYDRARATLKLAARVALKGGQRKLLTFIDPFQPACDDARHVYRAHTRMRGLRSVEVSMHVRCRRCAPCLQFRQMRWRERALAEIATANRTWMLTLTFSPVHMAGVLSSAEAADTKRVERRAYREVQLYFDRVRKSIPQGITFRYLAVFERGEKSGRMHYHVLLHETGRFPVPKSVLEEKWPSHVHARLVDPTSPGAASYVTKYATKDFSVRPRASGSYGNQLRERAHPPVKQSPSVSSLTHSKGESTNGTDNNSTELVTHVSASLPAVTLLKNGHDDDRRRRSRSRTWSCACSSCTRARARGLEFQAVSRSARAWAADAHVGSPDACGCSDCVARRAARDAASSSG